MLCLIKWKDYKIAFIRVVTAFVLLFLFTACGDEKLISSEVDNIKKLIINQAISANVSTQNADTYALPMMAKQFAVVRVMRGSYEAGKEVNLLITVYNPRGDIIEEVDTASGASVAVFFQAKRECTRLS